MKLERDKSVSIGALGTINFQRGIYAYVGSAMNNLESRVSRHFSREKRNHWHIDYFTEEAEALAFTGLAADSSWECRLAQVASENCEPVDGFGSSDCGCHSHLFRIGAPEEAPKQF
ncbi:MAG: DUF123 domain-containing protein [Candidatus Nanosalina sp.]